MFRLFFMKPAKKLPASQQVFKTLKDLKFDGWCCIEREAGSQRVADIRAARKMVESIEV